MVGFEAVTGLNRALRSVQSKWNMDRVNMFNVTNSFNN